jgi:NADH-quinone oxidoreductase subunit L
MEWTLLPLALIGFGGGLLNLPEYLGGGFLNSFLLSPGGQQHLSHGSELLLQALAAAASLGGIAVGWVRYGGRSRQLRLAEAQQPSRGLGAFLLDGWRFDTFYEYLFVRSYARLSVYLWERVDEGCIDDSLDRLAALLGRAGAQVGGWARGRISISLLSMAAGAAIIIAWLTWVPQ